MTALTKDKDVGRKEAGIQSFPVEDSVVIYKGAMVCVNTSGYVVPGADTQGNRFVGIAYEKVDNTATGHTQGGKSVRVYTEGVFLLVADSITQAMLGRKMFLLDDKTFDQTSDCMLEIGTLVEFVSTASGWVDIGQRSNLIGYQDHLYIFSDKSDKQVRIGNVTHTVAASILGGQTKPRAAVAMTNDIIGWEFEPRVNDGFATTGGICGVKATPAKAGNDNVGGIMRAYEANLGTDSGYSGTVTGPICALRAINNVHGTVTNGVYIIYAVTHGGNHAWDGLASLPNDGALAYESGGNGWFNVRIGTKVGHCAVTSMS